MAAESKREGLEIVALSSDGEGIARGADGPIQVPMALPGERGTLCRGEFVHEGPPSPQRRTMPLCPHFPQCGGCSVQHMGDQLYESWKLDLLRGALRQHKVAAEIAPPIRVPLGSRRRAMLAATRAPSGIVLGFYQASSHDVVAVTRCAVLHADIVALLPRLAALLDPILAAPARARIGVLLTDRGIDVDIADLGKQPTPGERARAAALAAAARIIRLVVAGEIWMQQATPAITVDGLVLLPPPGAFTQAARESEAAMVALAVGAVKLARAKRVADLFAGIGTFALPLARHAQVKAVDSDRIALAALTAAANNATGLKPIEALPRDLMRHPLAPAELKAFDAVVLDPPRAGAKDQAAALARSRVETVIAVSCHPGTFARDLAILAAGGFRIGTITPIDQFLFSRHLEAVAVLER